MTIKAFKDLYFNSIAVLMDFYFLFIKKLLTNFFLAQFPQKYSAVHQRLVLKIQICHNRNQLHFNIARDIVILNHHNFYYLFFKYIFLFFQINAALVFIKYIKNINRSY